MGYKRAKDNSFAEYQTRERFGSAVTGDIKSTEEVAKLAIQSRDALPAGLQGLNGYEGYPSHLSEYPEFAGEFGDDGVASVEISKIAERNMNIKPAGLQGYESFEGIEDDAFAGYGESAEAMSPLAQRSALEEDEEEAEGDDAFDGYGSLGSGEEQSFHTYFHKASMARTDSELIKNLSKAVQTVSPDTPESIRKQFYELAKEMLVRRKSTNMRHLDLQRAEIESNIGWLVNPNLPKTGGFQAVLNKAVGTIGSKLAKGEKDKIKADQGLALGKMLKRDLRKENRLGFSGLGNFSGGGKLTYIGLGLAGVLAVGIAYYMWSNKAAATPARRKKSRSRRKRK